MSYDHATYLSVLAAQSGCLSIVVPDPGLTATEWRAQFPNMLFGIAYGFDVMELEYARDTLPMLRPHLLAMKEVGREQCKELLKRLEELE